MLKRFILYGILLCYIFPARLKTQYPNLVFFMLIVINTFIISGAVFSQTKEIENFKLALAKAKTDTAKINLLNELSYSLYMSFEYDSSLKYGNRALEMSKKIKYMKGEGYALLYLACSYADYGKFEVWDSLVHMATAIAYKIKDKRLIGLTYHARGGTASYKKNLKEAFNMYDTALRYYMEIEDKKLIALIMRNYSGDYNQLSNYSESIRYTYMALKYFEEIGDKSKVGECYYYIGDAYKEYGNYSESLKIFFQALNIFEEISIKPHVHSDNKFDIAKTLSSIGEVYLLQGNPGSAIDRYSSALKVFEKYPNQLSYSGYIPSCNIGIGRAYELYGDSANATGDFEKARTDFSYASSYYKKALKMSQEMKYENEVAEASVFLGILGIKQKEYVNAENLLKQALTLSKKAHIIKLQRDCYLYLSRLYELTGNNNKAYDHYKKYILYRDSIVNEEAIRKTEGYKMQFEFGKKEDSLKQLHFVTETKLTAQKNQRYFYWGGLAMLTALVFFVFLNFRNQKKINRLADDAHAKEKAELELQSLRAQLNPHFMFNSLNAIQELILTEENEKSHSYLARFSKLMRLMLENTEKSFIPLQREIDFLQLYLSLENLRIPELQFSLTVDPPIDTEQTSIPNMILQPYIENAIWHGLSHKPTDKKLQIRITKTNGAIQYEIEDNGVGRKRSAELKSLFRREHKSKGMELLSKRFKLLSKELGADIVTSYEDVMNNGEVAGTLVTIKVPNNFSEEQK